MEVLVVHNPTDPQDRHFDDWITVRAELEGTSSAGSG